MEVVLIEWGLIEIGADHSGATLSVCTPPRGLPATVVCLLSPLPSQTAVSTEHDWREHAIHTYSECESPLCE